MLNFDKKLIKNKEDQFMSIHNLHWSPEEKKIAHAAFDLALKREYIHIKDELVKKVASIKENREVWLIHDYLSEKRDQFDEKYDFRYSRIIIVFGRLMYEGFLTEEDITGLSEDKINYIKKIAAFGDEF